MGRARDRKRKEYRAKREQTRLWLNGKELEIAFKHIREHAPYAEPGDSFLIVQIENQSGLWGFGFEADVSAATAGRVAMAKAEELKEEHEKRDNEGADREEEFWC